jgi:hypothetical protein
VKLKQWTPGFSWKQKIFSNIKSRTENQIFKKLIKFPVYAAAFVISIGASCAPAFSSAPAWVATMGAVASGIGRYSHISRSGSQVFGHAPTIYCVIFFGLIIEVGSNYAYTISGA